MSILLAGGGDVEALRPIADQFIARVAARTSESSATVAVVIVGSHAKQSLAELARLGFAQVGIELVPLIAKVDAAGTVTQGFDGGELLTADGILIADAQPAELLAALHHRVADIRRLAHEQVPFFGIGAGAVIASEAAIVSGNMIGGVPVAPKHGSAGEVRLDAGLGLIDLTVLSHAAQHGTVGLAVACCEAELVDRVLALDEGTAIEISEAGLGLSGTGSLWQITGSAEGVSVSTSRAE
ncbi:MAG: Type 1 glutamine amidotransferase-like domain-containing protein [Gulosibacter sp.]|uniref:Type 1 glutamine amidotransferase-like domain-containing protein n=1 Tax=Gulosibacter sp. TaxID=2817531 RepID=UPI003F92B589